MLPVEATFKGHISKGIKDIFHAIKKPLKKVSKKHPFYSGFTKEFGSVVRQGDDFGQERKNVTPGSESIMKNIDRFLNKRNSI